MIHVHHLYFIIHVTSAALEIRIRNLNTELRYDLRMRLYMDLFVAEIRFIVGFKLAFCQSVFKVSCSFDGWIIFHCFPDAFTFPQLM